jgi:hypothetical protein
MVSSFFANKSLGGAIANSLQRYHKSLHSQDIQKNSSLLNKA